MEHAALSGMGNGKPPVLAAPIAGSLPMLSSRQEQSPLALAGIAHDARNLVTALGLCAELVSEPGVLAPEHTHFAAEIRSLAEASGRLVQQLAALTHTETTPTFEELPAEAPIEDLACSVRQLGNLLSAIAGPVVELQMAALPCAGKLRLSEESLTRILVNLVRNAADAMPTGGRIRITTQRSGGRSFLWTVEDETLLSEEEAARLWGELDPSGDPTAQQVLLTVEDTGPGIPADARERIFEAGYSTRHAGRSWPETPHHGLGLSIVRTLVEKAGGRVRATAAPGGGARFEIELPITTVMGPLPSDCPRGEEMSPNDARM